MGRWVIKETQNNTEKTKFESGSSVGEEYKKKKHREKSRARTQQKRNNFWRQLIYYLQTSEAKHSRC